MKSLFNQSDCNEMIERINKVGRNTQPLWGKMNAAQMLTHAHRGLQSASGNLKLKRTVMGILFGALAKKKLVSDEPWKHNMPTDKHFIVSDSRNFDEEKEAVILALQRFSQAGAEGVSKHPHPFFGALTPREWDSLMWNHLDHHLRQFGV